MRAAGGGGGGHEKGLGAYQGGDLNYSGRIDLGKFALMDRAFLNQRGEKPARLVAMGTATGSKPGSLLWMLAGAAELRRRHG